MSETGDFDAFYASTSRRVVGHLYAMIGNLSEAEDAVQKAYARAWERWPKISTYGEPEAWVRTVAFRISVSSWRRARNRLTAHRRSGGGAVPGVDPDRLAVIEALRRIGSSSTTVPSTTTTPDPGRYVAGAWLTAGQEPYGGRIAWQRIGNLYGSRIGGDVFEDTDTSQAAALSMDDCSEQGFAPSLAGAQYEMFNGPDNGAYLTSTAIAASAEQGIYFYPSANAATAAWSGVAAAWHDCAAHQTGVDPTTGLQRAGSVEGTLRTSDAQCWSDLETQPSAGPTNGTLYHVCYVVHGVLVEWVSVTVHQVGSFSALDVGSTDASTLANMNSSLAAYGD